METQTGICVNTDSGSGLLLVGTKPLSEYLLTNHQLGFCVLKINGTLPVRASTSSSSVNLVHCDLVRQCGGTEICVISNSDSGLLPDGTKSLSE